MSNHELDSSQAHDNSLAEVFAEQEAEVSPRPRMGFSA